MSLSIGMVTIDCSDPQSLAQFWTAALGTTVAGDYGDFVLLAGTPALGLQKVPEPRGGKVGRQSSASAVTTGDRSRRLADRVLDAAQCLPEQGQ
ncbi:MAG: VOC family protein [Pseudonocardiaceae bacterium]